MQTNEQRVAAALWCVPGIGTGTIGVVRKALGDEVGAVLERPVREWQARVKWTTQAAAALAQVDTLAGVIDGVERRVKQFGYDIVFPGQPGWPERLDDIDRCPAVLFKLGPGHDGPRRRVAIVGTRSPETGMALRIRDYARDIAHQGIGIVSGGAIGVDQAAHFGAIAAGGETWAFLANAIDQVDAPQRPLLKLFRDHGGTLYSEFPPLVRADESTFVRRNRLISGAADAVLIMQAGRGSGARHTARFAREQGRKLLAMPGNPWCEKSALPNALLAAGARPFTSVKDVRRAVGLDGVLAPVASRELARSPISELAQRVLEVLTRDGADFDLVLGRCATLDAGQVAAALLELELCGHVLQKPGRRYERA